MERKNFLKSLPLIGLGGGMLLAGCNTTSSTDIDTGDSELEGDAFLIQDAAKIEAIGIQTYTAAAESGLIESEAVMKTALAFQSHHKEHLKMFNLLLEDLDVAPVKIDDFSADPGVNNVTNQTEVVELAMAVEYAAAEAYVTQLVNQLEGPRAREVFGGIYPVEVSHFITLKTALERSPAINAAVFEGLEFA